MRFELFIAARDLRAKRRQAVEGVITAISVGGVAAARASRNIAAADQRMVGDLLQSVKVGSAESLEPVGSAEPQVSDARPGAPDSVALPPIVIGHDLAETIGAGVEDTVWVTSPQGEL